MIDIHVNLYEFVQNTAFFFLSFFLLWLSLLHSTLANLVSIILNVLINKFTLNLKKQSLHKLVFFFGHRWNLFVESSINYKTMDY